MADRNIARTEILTLAGLVLLTAAVVQLFGEGLRRGFDLATHPWASAVVATVTALAAAGVTLAFLRRAHRRRERSLQGLLQEARDSAARTEALLQAVFENDPTALIVLDPELRIVHANTAARRVHGEGLEGRTCHDALEGKAEICPDCFLGALNSSEEPLPCLERDTARGEIVEVSSHEIDLPKAGRHSLLVQKVVTEHRKLQARLLHQEKMAAFGLLAAGIAHDMGNPLSAIGMHLQLLESQDMPPKARESLRVVREEVGRLGRTLRELVGFSRRRRDEAGLVSLGDVVRDALSLVHYDPRMRRVETSVECDPEASPVSMVEDHLMQVVLNLVLNALDAMPDGGRLELRVRAVEGKVVLRVRDTGHGMERGDLERAFEPMFSTKPAGSGTGLGLSICRDICRDAGGSIELHSVPGGGTTAILTLPEARSAGSERRVSSASAS